MKPAAKRDEASANDRGAARLGEVRAPKMAEVIANGLRRRIVRGELRVGDFLPSESALLSRMSISRAVLREALRILEAESLIRIRRGVKGGAEVCAPRIEVTARHFGLLLQLMGTTVADLFRARLAFEPIAARLLAQRGLGSGAERLERLLEEEKRLLDHPRMFAHTAVQFYEEVARQCGNQILALVCIMLRRLNDEKVDFVLRGYVKRERPPRATLRREVREIYEGHVTLLSLVRMRKPAQAEAHWRRHIEALERYLPTDAGKTSIEALR